MVRAIIFDFDDTLVRTKDTSFEKHAEVGRRFGFGLDRSLFDRHYGEPWPAMIAKCFPGLAFEDFYACLMEVERGSVFHEVEKATDVLRFFRGRGVRLGILTSDLRESLLRRAAAVGHLPYFDMDIVRCADDGEHAKPDGRAFLPIVERLGRQGIRKEEIVFVGDLPTDYQTARDAGVPFFAVMTGMRTAADFEAVGLARGRVLASVAELPSRLEARHG
jgi:phosphoglycolate phosphatase-like HAD superfamily hydrolase